MANATIKDILQAYPELAELIAQGKNLDTNTPFDVLDTVNDGQFSTGAGVEFHPENNPNAKVFVSRPDGTGFGLTNTLAQQIETTLEGHRDVPGTMQPLHTFIIDDEGHVMDLSRAVQLVRVAEHLPDGAVNIFKQLREALGQKWSDEQIISHFGPINLKVADILSQIHGQEIPEDIQANAANLYSESLWRVHSDKELTAGLIHKQNFAEKKWVKLPQVLQLQSLMVQFEHHMRNRTHRLKPLHGDPWWRNAYLTPEGDVAFIDQSRSAYGEPATDLALGIGDSINSSIIRNETADGPFMQVAQLGLDSYLAKTGDTEVLEMLPMAFAYKTFALAINNPMLQDEGRRRLFAAGFGCLALAVDALDHGEVEVFDLKNVQNYMEFGLTLLD